MIKVVKPGLYSTIQDLGRKGKQSYGIPCSGSMDSFSSDLANKILNNSINSSPSVSDPTTDATMGFAPRFRMFNATLPAPPILFSFLLKETTGTGASGLTLVTLPRIYPSSITSPITRMRFSLKLSRSVSYFT